jgi:hypothetical protein
VRAGPFILVLVFVTRPVFAQRPAVGVTVSITRSTFTDGAASGAGDAGTGFSVGASLRQAITSRLWLEPELRLARQHAGTRGYPVNCPETLSRDCAPYTGGSRVAMTTLELPVLIRAALPRPARAVRPFLTVGSSVSYRAGCTRYSDNGAGGELESTCDLVFPNPLTDPVPGLPALQSFEFRRWDLALVAGGGAEVNGIVIEARFHRGLRRVEEAVPFAMSQMDRSRFFGVALSVGVWLPSLAR